MVYGIEETADGHNARRVIVSNEIDFATAYSLYVDQVYRYALSRVGNVPAAEDITSETFLTALERYDSFRGEGTLAAWILGIARHKVADYFRSRLASSSWDVIEHVPSAEPSPPQAAEYQLRLEQVHEALRSLSPDRVDALTLYAFAGLSVNEISLVLGKSEAAVRMLIHRAVQDLKTRLIPQEGIER